ncbi:hypothetical protein GQ600_21944 [Phytophthora cactorum]|nr:hypothetical protein GQ600_21944 [Phytophthora cactorum]
MYVISVFPMLDGSRLLQRLQFLYENDQISYAVSSTFVKNGVESRSRRKQHWILWYNANHRLLPRRVFFYSQWTRRYKLLLTLGLYLQVDEDRTLKTLYQEKVSVDQIARAIESKARFGFDDVDDALIAQICRRRKCVLLPTLTSVSENCTWRRKSNKIRKWRRPCKSMKEKRWDYSRSHGARSVEDLRSMVNVAWLTKNQVQIESSNSGEEDQEQVVAPNWLLIDRAKAERPRGRVLLEDDEKKSTVAM